MCAGELCNAIQRLAATLCNFLAATFNLLLCCIITDDGRASSTALEMAKQSSILIDKSAEQVVAELKQARADAQASLNEGAHFEDGQSYKNMPSGGEWKRAKDCLPVVNNGTPASLFGEDGAKPMDLGQGSVGDCYLLSSFAALAEEAGRVEMLFANGSYGGDGTSHKYVVFFYKEDRWHPVEVDDRLWVDRNSSKPIFCNSKGTSRMWPMLLEKAYCKFEFGGDWSKMNGGQPYHAMHRLRGCSSGRVPTDSLSRDLSDEQLYKLLHQKIVSDPNGMVVASLEAMPWASCVPTVRSNPHPDPTPDPNPNPNPNPSPSPDLCPNG
jgi:hypothetical protein